MSITIELEQSIKLNLVTSAEMEIHPQLCKTNISSTYQNDYGFQKLIYFSYASLTPTDLNTAEVEKHRTGARKQKMKLQSISQPRDYGFHYGKFSSSLSFSAPKLRSIQKGKKGKPIRSEFMMRNKISFDLLSRNVQPYIYMNNMVNAPVLSIESASPAFSQTLNMLGTFYIFPTVMIHTKI